MKKIIFYFIVIGAILTSCSRDRQKGTTYGGGEGVIVSSFSLYGTVYQVTIDSVDYLVATKGDAVSIIKKGK